MENNLYSIILAGGSGSRLWPLSRDLHPKQLLKINDDLTLIQRTFLRLAKICDKSNIISVTNVKHQPSVQMQLREFNDDIITVTEPVGKNTAPAIAMGVLFAVQNLANDNDPIILVSPSDHIIKNDDAFYSAIEKGAELAQAGQIVTFGITPKKPDTGFGYIKADSNLKVEEFKEKPDEQTAQKYLKDGNYYWNAGLFMFKASVLIQELKKYQPDIFEILTSTKISKNLPSVDFDTFNKLPNISIDYAIMEKSQKVSLIPMDCEWSDVGSWEAIYDVSEKDSEGNHITGKVVAQDCQNSLIHSSSKLVAAVGIKDTVIVETEDAILVCDKNKAQDVKKVFNHLKSQDNQTFMLHKTVYRPWGYYTVLNEGDGFLTKLIQVNPKAKLSIQLHHHRSEHWVLLEGKAKVVKGEEDHFLQAGDSIDIAVEEKHSLQNPYDEPLKILEVQKGSYISEDDIVRLEDMYGRA